MKMFWFALLTSIFLFPQLGSTEPEPAKLEIVATNSIVADWVKNIAGDKINLHILVGPDGDVHTFEPTPSDNIALNKAKIIFEIGFGFEHWMDQLYEASDSQAKRIVLTKGIVQQPLAVLRLGREHQEDADPHVWHNVRYVMGMVGRISQIFKSFDPEHAKEYEANAKSYLKQLQELENWAMRTVSQVSPGQRKLITNHDSLSYFCEHYQFQLIGAVFDSMTTEAEDPSAKSMAKLIFKIKQSGVRVVFAENIHNSKVLESIAQESKIILAPPLYTDALGVSGGPADTYIKMMRYNVETIVKALQDKI